MSDDERDMLELEIASLRWSLGIALMQLSGECGTCRFIGDCVKHDNNDAAPPTWHYDCSDWKWNHLNPLDEEDKEAE